MLPHQLAASPAPQRVAIGNGSGHLRYPDAQATLKLNPGDTLYINPGTYRGLSLGNLSGTADAPITVTCDPNTVFTTPNAQPNEFPNIAHVRFENFRFVNYNSTCMRITGRSHDLLFKNFCITNASGYCFHVYDPAKIFDGTRESTFYNFKWENVVVDGKVNGAAISNSDYQPVSNLKSVLLDFEIYRCTFRHFDNTKLAFPVIGLDKCFNLRVHECTFSDIGMAESPIGHNVCICGAGYFKVCEQPVHPAMGQRRARVADETQRAGLQRTGRRQPLLQQHQLGEAQIPDVRAQPRAPGRPRQVIRVPVPDRLGGLFQHALPVAEGGHQQRSRTWVAWSTCTAPTSPSSTTWSSSRKPMRRLTRPGTTSISSGRVRSEAWWRRTTWYSGRWNWRAWLILQASRRPGPVPLAMPPRAVSATLFPTTTTAIVT